MGNLFDCTKYFESNNEKIISNMNANKIEDYNSINYLDKIKEFFCSNNSSINYMNVFDLNMVKIKEIFLL